MEVVELELKEHLKDHFGFDHFKGDQELIIESLLGGNDTFVIMPTGGGKSLCYQLPALMSEGTAIVVSPLIALMKNQVDAIRGFSQDDSIAHYLNSSLTKAKMNEVKDDVLSGKTKLLYVAPESLTKEDNVAFLKSAKISFFAVDEAHCISEWGHDFRPEYRRLRSIVESIERVPIIALTATATPKVQSDIQKNLGMENARVFKSSFNRPNLYYEVRPKVNVIKSIIQFVKQYEGKSGIIYCLSRKKVEELAEVLQVNGVKALAYHAGLDAVTRAKHQDMFLMEDADVIVATIAFGMGIDKPDVRFVIHHDIPKSLEGYYQETGRAGRDGGEGRCLAFYSYKDIEKLEKFLQGKPVAEQEVGRQLIFETVSFAETAVCRRRQLLHYFGEAYNEAECKANQMCDNCSNPKETFEAKEDVLLLLKTIEILNENYKANYISNFISGSEIAEIKTNGHTEHSSFGIGKTKEKEDKYWEAIIRQSIIHELLYKEVENYGILRLSEGGKKFLKNPRSMELIKAHDYSDGDCSEEAAMIQHKGGATDEHLFKLLKDLRKDVAKSKGLPPYVIFQDPSLEEMCSRYPITMEELSHISGVGMGKAQKFGEPFLELIQRYVEENGIERPEDLVFKSMVNKSGKKVFIVQSIDRLMTLEDISEAKGLSVDEIITEMEHIVSSGTKVNIRYLLDDLLDEEYQKEIVDYLTESQTDNIETLIEDFDDAYSEEELRLVRLQFISDVGN